MQHQQHLTSRGLRDAFPDQFKQPTPNQNAAIDLIAQENGNTALELPTGTGKTALGITFLNALQNQGAKILFYVTSNKTLVNQIALMHPEVHAVYGRNEYPCLYYDQEITAEEAPCSLIDCSHRVNQLTGLTQEEGYAPCPYLLAKHKAKQGGIIVSTLAFYLFTHVFSQEFDQPDGLVIDEAHNTARIVRDCLSYRISDYHIQKSIDFLASKDLAEESKILSEFLKVMKKVIASKKSDESLLTDDEINSLLDILGQISFSQLQRKISKVAKKSPEEREALKTLENISKNLRQVFSSLEYALPGTSHGKNHGPLNFTYGYIRRDKTETEKIENVLFVKAYHVAPLIKKRLLGKRTLAYSATIGDQYIFSQETGIDLGSFHSLGSDFPSENSRVYLPSDTPNLAVKARSAKDLNKITRKIIRACLQLSSQGIRSLIVVVSNDERERFLKFAKEEGLKAISYGNGITPRQSVEKFKAGEGDVLIGTIANYGEGLDLPKAIAPVIFFLRPGYPKPTDPASLFEERKFGSMRWAIWNWRVMIEAMQVRGRNIRSKDDIGTTIFISQQFRRFLYAALPASLKNSYQGEKTFDQCLEDIQDLL